MERVGVFYHISSYTPRIYQETSSFLMLTVGIEREYWFEMG